MSEYRVLVCGGRNYFNRPTVYKTLDALQPKPTLLICGGWNGADGLAADWAIFRQVHREIYYADWQALGRSAGPIRNQKMLDEGRPALVVAFPGGRGTADMVRRAKVAGVPVMEIDNG